MMMIIELLTALIIRYLHALDKCLPRSMKYEHAIALIIVNRNLYMKYIIDPTMIPMSRNLYAEQTRMFINLFR